MKTIKIILVLFLLSPFAFGQQKSVGNQPHEKVFNFTFENSSLKSIPLLIPGVMNPNLSPFSKSGVTLKMGQKVYFNEHDKRYLLLVVDSTNYNGEVIVINQLIKKRKKELNL